VSTGRHQSIWLIEKAKENWPFRGPTKTEQPGGWSWSISGTVPLTISDKISITSVMLVMFLKQQPPRPLDGYTAGWTASTAQRRFEGYDHPIEENEPVETLLQG
jgi:hypothetical protein